MHRRSVLLWDEELVVVVDRITGEGEHAVRLHWLCGKYPHTFEPGIAAVNLETPEGPYMIAAFDALGRRLPGSVARGVEEPPRGWSSRHYGEKTAVPSLAVEEQPTLPVTWISVLGPGKVSLERNGTRYTSRCEGRAVSFEIEEGLFANLAAVAT